MFSSLRRKLSRFVSKLKTCLFLFLHCAVRTAIMVRRKEIKDTMAKLYDNALLIRRIKGRLCVTRKVFSLACSVAALKSRHIPLNDFGRPFDARTHLSRIFLWRTHFTEFLEIFLGGVLFDIVFNAKINIVHVGKVSGCHLIIERRIHFSFFLHGLHALCHCPTFPKSTDIYSFSVLSALILKIKMKVFHVRLHTFCCVLCFHSQRN